MSATKLRVAEGADKGRVWLLTRTRAGLVLRDQDGDVVQTMDAGTVSQRFRFPSFWFSILHITIKGEGATEYLFEAKKEKIARVKSLIAECVEQNPDAAAAVMRKRGWRDLIYGSGSFLFGLVVTVAILAGSGDRKPEHGGSGGAVMVPGGFIVVGVGQGLLGAYWLYRAATVPRSADDEPEDVPEFEEVE